MNLDFRAQRLLFIVYPFRTRSSLKFHSHERKSWEFKNWGKEILNRDFEDFGLSGVFKRSKRKGRHTFFNGLRNFVGRRFWGERILSFEVLPVWGEGDFF